MIDTLGSWFAPFWGGLAVHLWQSALFLAVLALVARALRHASARMLSILYWVGILKLLLPLPLLGPLSDRLLQAIAGASAAIFATEAGWSTVTVLIFPMRFDPGPAGWWVPEPGHFVALTATWFLVAAWLFAGRLRPKRSRSRLRWHRVDARAGETSAKLRTVLADAGLSFEDVRISSEIPAPLVRGKIRPVMVLPEPVIAGLSRDELKAVVVHEREHLRRRDPLRYAVLGVVRDLLWFYPPVWWLARRIRESTEMACDEAVVTEGLPVATYCRSLARTVSLGLGHRAAVSPVGVLGHRVSFLRRRLERIRSGRRFEAMFAHRLVVLAAVLAALVMSLLPLVPVEGIPQTYAGPDQQADADPPPEEAGDCDAEITKPVVIDETKVKPTYPEEARKNQIQGSVSLEAVIDETGTVTKVRALKSKPKDYQPFIDAATEAVRQWRYEPATQDGEPVGITLAIQIKFALS